MAYFFGIAMGEKVAAFFVEKEFVGFGDDFSGNAEVGGDGGGGLFEIVFPSGAGELESRSVDLPTFADGFVEDGVFSFAVGGDFGEFFDFLCEDRMEGEGDFTEAGDVEAREEVGMMTGRVELASAGYSREGVEESYF